MPQRVELWLRRFDRLALVVAVIIALPTLSYPFGRDQALYHYVGREWSHGLLPYRDVFDQKPPLIYLVHAIGIGTMGGGQWVIRFFDLGACVAMGWAVARLFRRSVPGRSPGFGVGALVVSLIYFLSFDYWDTAQVEIWLALFVMLSTLAARDLASLGFAAASSGALLGMAFLFKFTALLWAPLPACVLVHRTLKSLPGARRWRLLGRSGLMILLGLAVPVLLLVSWMAAQGGLGDCLDVLIGYNRFYAVNKRASGFAPLGRFLFGSNLPITGLALSGAVALGANSPRSKEFAWMDALVVGMAGSAVGLASVWLQGKYYGYHWGVLVPFEAALVLGGVVVLGRVRPLAMPIAIIGVTAMALLTCPSWRCNPHCSYCSYVVSWWRYLTDPGTEFRFLSQFVGGYGYEYAPLKTVGDRISRLARPSDQLHVHGFEPIPYVTSGLRSPSRFFAEFPLNDPALAYRRVEWLAQHERALARSRPRFIVDFTAAEQRFESRRQQGYRREMRSGRFTLWVRDEPGGR